MEDEAEGADGTDDGATFWWGLGVPCGVKSRGFWGVTKDPPPSRLVAEAGRGMERPGMGGGGAGEAG